MHHDQSSKHQPRSYEYKRSVEENIEALSWLTRLKKKPSIQKQKVLSLLPILLHLLCYHCPPLTPSYTSPLPLPLSTEMWQCSGGGGGKADNQKVPKLCCMAQGSFPHEASILHQARYTNRAACQSNHPTLTALDKQGHARCLPQRIFPSCTLALTKLDVIMFHMIT